MKSKNRKLFTMGFLAMLIILVSTIAYYLFASISISGETSYLYIDEDDDIDSIATKLRPLSRDHGVAAIKVMARHTDYTKNIRTGRYAIEPSIGALMFFRHLRNGQQEPVRLTIPSVRTMDRLAEELSRKLMMSEAELMAYFSSNDSCQVYGLDTATIPCLFIPNTYEVYWNISPKKLLDHMQKERTTFWNIDRMGKAKNLALTPEEVITMASIIEEETANNSEKPMVAGMYYNRLCKHMPLQADPTIKFAMKNFEAHRIYRKWLTIPSPYNTYINEGLPPGPIRIPSVTGIDAVLNLVKHDYVYMCAKEDFSGTHNFARTYSEHLQNAAKYTKALNERGIN